MVSALKKGEYKGNNLPKIEVVMGIKDRATAKALVAQFFPEAQVTSDTKLMTKYAEVGHAEVSRLLDLPVEIEANYKGRVWVMKGTTGPIKTRVWFDRAEISIKENEIKIKGRGISAGGTVCR